MIGPMPFIRSSAMQARPTGPAPMTTALSPALIRLFATACTPTASGSVIAASSTGRPAGTFMPSISFSTIRSA